MGILALYVAGGSQSFSFLTFEAMQIDPVLQTWVFLAFYVGFGILAGIWPLHTWSPDGHASAPTAVSMLHAGVLMKLGAYGVVRLGIGLLPEAAVEWAWLVGTIACINIVYGALSAMAQKDLKYVIAYSSVSHMGVVMLGAATLTVNGPQRLRLPDVRPRDHDWSVLRAGRLGVREGALARDFQDGRLRDDDARHCHRLHDRRLVIAWATGDCRLRGRVPHLSRDVEFELQLVAVPSGGLAPS